MESTRQPAAKGARLSAFRRFIIEHEDRWAFVILYVGLAVILSFVLSLFWLVVLLAVHVVFEIIAHTPAHRGLRLAGETLWAVKLDIALLFLAFTLALYLEHVLGLLGLRAAAQAGAALQTGSKVGTRAAAWTRGIRSVLLATDDAVQVARAAGRRGKAAPADDPHSHGPSWNHKWRWGEWVTVGLGVSSVILLALTPVLTDHTVASAYQALLTELRPFP